MAAAGDGDISAAEFCRHFEKQLPADPIRFDVLIEQFHQIAEACRERKHKSRTRLLKLLQVFMQLDLDGSGMLEEGELFKMGAASWQLGGRAGEWTMERNNQLMAKLDANADGMVLSRTLFTTYGDSDINLDNCVVLSSLTCVL